MNASRRPILLFNDECAVCRRIARWVEASSSRTAAASLDVRPIGDDPAVLENLNPELTIWDAYEIIHLLMPDGSMKTGGEAVAEVLRSLPGCAWFAWTFRIGLFGVRPFQLILNLGYTMLAAFRPLLGCESCGLPNPWVKFAASLLRPFAGGTPARFAPRHPHFTPSDRKKPGPAAA